MFFGREKELNTLNKLYESNKFEFAVIYGRLTAQLKIEAQDYRECSVFNKNLSAEQKAIVYGVTGGIHPLEQKRGKRGG